MKITHKKTWEPVVITLETKDEVRVLAAILGELTDSDVNELCKRYKDLFDAAKMACKMTDVLYTRLSESIE